MKEVQSREPREAHRPRPLSPYIDRIKHAAIVVLGVASFCAIDRAVAELLRLGEVRFPSFVAGMLLCFGVLSLGRAFAADSVERVVRFLEPARSFLSRWMALFFVPPLVLLPLVERPRLAELLTVVFVLAAGFVFTLVSTAWLAHTIGAPAQADAPVLAGTSLRWSPRFVLGFWGIAMIVSHRLSHRLQSLPVQLCYGVACSVVCFVLAELLKDALALRAPRLALLFHPVLLSAFGSAVLWSSAGFTLSDYLRTPSPIDSPGEVFSFLLRPAVVALGLALDAQRRVLRAGLLPLLAATGLAAIASLFVTAFAVGRLGLLPVYARALISRSVTTPVALAMADALGANPGLTAVFVILTGLFGALFAVPILARLGLAAPFVLGVATGASSHGIGTAALSRDYPVAAAMAGVSFALMAVISVTLVSVDFVADALLFLSQR